LKIPADMRECTALEKRAGKGKRAKLREKKKEKQGLGPEIQKPRTSAVIIKTEESHRWNGETGEKVTIGIWLLQKTLKEERHKGRLGKHHPGDTPAK